jgi:hypothetical protein
MRNTFAVWLFRIFMVATFPVVMPVIVLGIAAHEFRHAAHMTWLGAKLEWASLVAMLQCPPIKGGDGA